MDWSGQLYIYGYVFCKLVFFWFFFPDKKRVCVCVCVCAWGGGGGAAGEGCVDANRVCTCKSNTSSQVSNYTLVIPHRVIQLSTKACSEA